LQRAGRQARLSGREFEHLKRFWTANEGGDGTPISEEVDTYQEVKVNGLLVRTESFDETVGTCDSVIGSRYEDGGGQERMAYYGVVLKIIVSRGEPLLACRRFEDLDMECTDEELVLSCRWRRLKVNLRHPHNQMMWAPLHCIALDEHIIWPTNVRETEFGLAVKH
jgi:hypothetical protein